MLDQQSLLELVVGALIAGTSSFIATNIDDVVVLMVLFSRTDHRLRDRQILIGRYLGFGIIILASLVGFLGGFLLPSWVVGLLGFFPITIGILQLRSSQLQISESPASQIDSLAFKHQQLVERSPNFTSQKPFKKLHCWLPWLSPQVLQVAMITVACGADNIGIYIPLFASCNWLELSIILSIFFVGVGLLCWVTRRFSRHRMITQRVSWLSCQFAPWIFIILGIGIFWKSEILKSLLSFIFS